MMTTIIMIMYATIKCDDEGNDVIQSDDDYDDIDR